MEPVIESFEIARIKLENVRGLRAVDLNLCDPVGVARKRILVIGKNGTCKSSLLRAIALGLADQTDASKLISEPVGGMISQDAEESRIEVELVATGQSSPSLVSATTLFKSNGKEEVRPKDLWGGKRGPGIAELPLELFVCGYGAGRFGIGSETSREYRIADSVYTLFNYHQALIGTELTLRRLKDFLGTKVYERTLSGIKRALGFTDDHEIRLGYGGGVEIFGPTVGNAIRLEGWADGYRMTFMWIVDLYAWAMKAGSIDEDGHIKGILLIDEIEQHLHPSMQAEILPRLSELLPKMQIFATTHSPLVALDAKPEELVVLKREGNRVVAEEDVPNFLGYTVEDMLADPRLFDSEIYGQETRNKLTEYRDLAAIPREERDDDQRHRLRSLATEIRSLEGYKESENETSRLLKEFMTKYGL